VKKYLGMKKKLLYESTTKGSHLSSLAERFPRLLFLAASSLKMEKPLTNASLIHINTYNLAHHIWGGFMRTTLNIEDELLARAAELTGIKEKTSLVRLGLEALIARESAKRLAALGGTEKNLEMIPRRRVEEH
jgi:Arc/MetJ family transcription regulator